MLTILDPGIANSIQDAGRWGYQAFGVPVSGAMDVFALRAANALVQNAREDAALEIHSPIILQTDQHHLIALTGADARFEINGRVMPMWMSVFVRGGSQIEIAPTRGWTYLAVSGAIDAPRVLGSKSFYTRAGIGHALAAGAAIAIGESRLGDLLAGAGRALSDRARAFANRAHAVRVIAGPHADWFANDLAKNEYALSETADRMGYRLRGAPIARCAGDLISCGVTLGAIQVPADGQPIVLMADHQTTGGYPVIATVIGADVPLIAQRAPGDRIAFEIVEIETAERAWRAMLALVD
jgi:biotin-dependent carboxylase-like uncharacterized protein